ncbi:S8 family serine peptidase [Psychrobacillus sp. FJAT-51614]|uniref:S8 family serine peptidase n=1 Tax=Psychrobacillus mangrovi TaxID=3117745 RepID=A0ABU8F1G4_9BACI
MKRFLFASTLFLFVIFGAFPASAVVPEYTIVEVTNEKHNQILERNLKEEVYTLNNAKVLQPNYIRSVGMIDYNIATQSWGAERIGASRLKSLTASINDSVIVAIIDTGVDYNHPFLKDRMVAGYDFVDNDTDPMDVHFHGTHIAGIVADTTPPNVKIMPIRALNEKGNGYDLHVSKGIRYAVDNGAEVINLSFSGDTYSAILASAIKYALSKNVPIILAAGNESIDTKHSYPASEDNVIVVSATDKNDIIASFSNNGSSIDISAPGVDIVSTIPGGQYGSVSGTSMAAPFVSGIVAMMKLENSSRNVQQIELLLKKYVDDKGEQGWDPIYGEGIVNVKHFEENTMTLNNKTSQIAEQKDIPLNKKFTVKMSRKIYDNDTLEIKLYREGKEVPITLSSYLNKKEIIVTPNELLLPNTKYLLVIKIEDHVTFEKYFVTKSLN